MFMYIDSHKAALTVREFLNRGETVLAVLHTEDKLRRERRHELFICPQRW